jgi:hypothetical protein
MSRKYRTETWKNEIGKITIRGRIFLILPPRRFVREGNLLRQRKGINSRLILKINLYIHDPAHSNPPPCRSDARQYGYTFSPALAI